ncbi:MAG: ATP-binding protein [Candidatus Cyclobacteriaceae bacterium M3_2C_046]
MTIKLHTPFPGKYGLSRYYILLIICLCYLGASAIPSAKIDSLRQLLDRQLVKDTTYLENLIQLAQEMRSQDLEEASVLFKQAITLSGILKAQSYQTNATLGLAISYGMKNQYAQAIRFFNLALDLSKKHQLPEQAGNSYDGLGIVFKRMGDYPSSLSFYNRSLFIFIFIYDSLQDLRGIASSHQNIAILFDLMKEPEQALEHYEIARDIYKANGDQKSLTVLESNIGMLHLQLQEFDQALDIFLRNLEFFQDQQMFIHSTRSMANPGFTHYQVKDYDKAIHYLEKAIYQANEAKISDILLHVTYSLSKVYAEQGKSNQSFQLANQVKLLADSLTGFSFRSMAQELLAHVEEKAGNISQAYMYYKNHKSLEDSILNETKMQVFKNQQVLMEVNQKNRQLEEQSIRLAFLNDRFILQNRWKWTLAGASIFLFLAGIAFLQKYRIKKIHTKQLEEQNLKIKQQKEEIETINQELKKQIILRKETDATINYFATSLFGKNTVEEILWDVAKNCISRLGLEDCVIYLLDDYRGMLVQKAAYGNKNPEDFRIHQPIEIPLGQGIVGSVALSGQAELIYDTSLDHRYIVDDQNRLSELAIPIFKKEKVIGVIDSEHPQKGFFQLQHLEALKTIAAICGSKIAQAEADLEAKKAQQAQLEAEQIKQMDQLKSRFYANVSHEFRTPLHLILAPFQKNKYPLTHYETDQVHRNARRLLRLVNQLMDLAKIEVGLAQMDYRDFYLSSFVDPIAQLFNPMAVEKEIIYKIIIPEQELIVRLDPDKMEKIIYNLLSNAFKFTPAGGVVSLHLEIVDPDRINLVVSDSGIGIPLHLQEKIFERFFQADNSNTRSYEGSGIGLSLTRELVEMHQGSINLDSKEGKGCIFAVALPRNADPAQPILPDQLKEATLPSFSTLPLSRSVPEEIPEPAQPVEHLPQVLLVEDHDDLRNYLLQEMKRNYNLIAAPNGKTGFNLALEKIPDLIITDIMMPEMDGLTLTRLLRDDTRTCHIPVIMLTARDEKEIKLKGFEQGAIQYLTKPFDMNELQAIIQSLFNQRDKMRRKLNQEILLQPSLVNLENPDEVFLQKLVKLIEANIENEAFSVEQLQKEIAMSRMQLHRKLKALTNQSASEFIRSVKLKRAAQILRQPGVQITEAAYMAGFNHMSYFSKCFKEMFGMLPSEFVKNPASE